MNLSEIDVIKLDEITPNSWNPNTMNEEAFEKLKTSIEVTQGDYLQDNPIKVRKFDGGYQIIDGEHRWRVCKELGYEVATCMIMNVTEEQARCLSVILNKDRGHINYFKLSKMLNEEYEEYSRDNGTNQEELAQKYGYARARIAKILPIFIRLQKCAHAHTFSNRQLEELASVRNELFRDMLIERTVVREWSSTTIRKRAVMLNQIEDYIQELSKDIELQETTIKSLIEELQENLLDYDFSALKNEVDAQFKKQQAQRIIHGDMFEVIDNIENESIDCILTDPPYGVSNERVHELEGRKDITRFLGEWDEFSEQEYVQFTCDWLEKVTPKLKNGGPLFIFTSDIYLSYVIRTLRILGLKDRKTIIWHKTNPTPSVDQDNFVSSVEYIIYATKGKPKTFNWLGQNLMHNFVECSIPGNDERVGHPTQKPLKLVEFLLKIATNTGDTVLDPFAGSGTTAVACKNLGRAWIMIEKEEQFVKMIERRVTN